MSFLLNNTVAEILTTLAGNDPKKAHSMKLYVRERGQDRLMLPSERPIALQARRLYQAGFTEAEHLEEIGKDDWSFLCKFIYQTPVLPVMNPVSSFVTMLIPGRTELVRVVRVYRSLWT